MLFKVRFTLAVLVFAVTAGMALSEDLPDVIAPGQAPTPIVPADASAPRVRRDLTNEELYRLRLAVVKGEKHSALDMDLIRQASFIENSNVRAFNFREGFPHEPGGGIAIYYDSNLYDPAKKHSENQHAFLATESIAARVAGRRGPVVLDPEAVTQGAAASTPAPKELPVPKTLAELMTHDSALGAKVQEYCGYYDSLAEPADRADYIRKAYKALHNGEEPAFPPDVQTAYNAKYTPSTPAVPVTVASQGNTVFPIKPRATARTQSGTYTQPTHTTGGVVAQQAPAASSTQTYREGKPGEVWYNEVGDSSWDNAPRRVGNVRGYKVGTKSTRR